MELVAEPVVSELFKGLFKILESTEVGDFARNLVGGVDPELKELKKKMLMVENLLRNAEDKQLTDKSVKEWLDNLQHWAYDAEDLLDEFAYKASRRKLKAEHQASSSKGRSFLPASFHSPLFNVRMGSKIKDITSRLEQLRQERSAEYEMQVVSGGTSSNVAAPQRPEETSSVPPEQVVYGRVEDEAKLLDMVKSAQPSGANFRVIAIVGMGGIGKTTIARKIYNHMQELEDFKFEKKAWVCVSNNFDVLTISKALLESIDSSLSSPNNLNEVQVKLRETVNQKRFLLVLDDVWNDEYAKLEVLKSPFKAGAPGSTMIITTRLESVASAIRSSDTYPLKPISDYHCWQLFQEHAFGDGSIAEAHEIHDSIRKGVFERCRGLPLAAKTLGGLLHSKPCDTWGKILNSNVWSTSNESDHILPALRLSYHYLPSNLKRCFGYCALFPKDYEFKEKELALLWMAEGIVQPSDKQLDKAGEYFHDLCSRSLLQKWSSHSSIYVMHDLVHDLAESVFKEFNFRSEKAILELPENINKIRHFSYISDKVDREKKFKGLEKLESLRTFLPVFMCNEFSYISASVIFDLLPKLEKLRVLSLERYNITHLPYSLGDLIHMRYLNFSQTRIKSLPESTSQLFNLQTLLLKDCYRLAKLPSNMRYLANLYHLDISGCNSLKEMPSRMKELKNLRMLSSFIVGKEWSSNLEDLKSLSFLQGELRISKLDNITDPKQIGGQILSNKDNLKVLSLEWGSQVFGDSRKEDVEMHVLDKLKPPSSLVEFTIKCYGGQSFPSNWFKDPPSLSNLVVLKLKNCEKCKSLPSLETLSSLKDLTIEGMTSLKRIDFQMPLKSLEVLHFMNLQEWEHWDTWRGNEAVERLAQLRELCIEKCPRLTGEFPDHLPSLERFVIRDSSKLVVSVSSLQKQCKVVTDWLHEGVVCNDGSIDFESLDSRWLSNISEVESKLKQGFQRVDCLTIDGSDKITIAQKWFPNIERRLILGGMHGLTFLEQFLPNLRVLEFKICHTLISLPGELKQKNLEILSIRKCDSLRSIDCSMLPSSLKELSIFSCEKLEFLKDLSTSLLEELRISFCNSLTCTSPRDQCLYLPKALKFLYIYQCRELKSINGSFEKSTCLKSIFLLYCENLESIPLGLQNLSRVEYLRIERCPKLLVREGIPTSLIDLYFGGGLKFDKPMIEWELHNLTDFSICDCEDAASILQNLTSLNSLTRLTIRECPVIESIPNLTSLTSLRSLYISNCERLKSIPALGSVENLEITGCPKLKFVQSLPSSLLYLRVKNCPLLKKQWNRGKKRYCSMIAYIPAVYIDDKFIFNSKEEDK